MNHYAHLVTKNSRGRTKIGEWLVPLPPLEESMKKDEENLQRMKRHNEEMARLTYLHFQEKRTYRCVYCGTSSRSESHCESCGGPK